MSNDMPDVIYAGVDNTNIKDWYWRLSDSGLETKYYSESHVQQLIKEAEERQREKCASTYIDGCYELAESENRLIVEAILNAK